MHLNNEQIEVTVIGHGRITDDLGNVLLDKYNAIHPQNISRVFARALANEHNYFIHRIAFGNGGTSVDAAETITYFPPNDGQSPDTATWDSRLYNETFSKIIDDGQVVLNPYIGIDPGSADINSGIRSGGGSVPASDPPTIPHVSGPGVRSIDTGLKSEVVISATINADEPKSQFLTDTSTSSATQSTESEFVFDEIGLYTSGTSALSTPGYQYIDVGDRTSTSDTGLERNTNYSFRIAVDGGDPVVITFHTPLVGGSGSDGQILYGDLCQAINTGASSWGLVGSNPMPNDTTLSITDDSGGIFPSIVGANTYGFLKFASGTVGSASSIELDNSAWDSHETLTSLLPAINTPLGGTLQAAVQGTGAGLQNSPTNPTAERERLLSHLIFSPILKAKNRTLNIVYTLTISIARTPR